MEKEVAIIICNWNKKNYVLKCIESVLNLKFQKYDLYVVDNASTDGSPEAIISQYGQNLTLIQKEENKGGSDGFNTGIKEALKRGYKYLYLLDDDVLVRDDALTHLYDYLENNIETAIVGSKILYMDNMNQIQFLGADVDWECFNIRRHYENYIDDGNLPEILDVDFVPACSLLIRSEVLRKLDIQDYMDPGYFIYWDEIDLAYYLKQRGYRIVVNTNSVIWHKRGAINRSDTLGLYYGRRNRTYFITKYIDPELIPLFAKQLLDELFKEFYFGSYKGRYTSARSTTMAVSDALNGIRGKANHDRIYDLEILEDRLSEIISNHKSIALIYQNKIDLLNKILCRIESVGHETKFVIVADDKDKEELTRLKNDISIIGYEGFDKRNYDLVIQQCDHIVDTNYIEKHIADLYIDPYLNIVFGEQDRNYVANYERIYEAFKQVYLPLLESKIYALKRTFS